MHRGYWAWLAAAAISIVPAVSEARVPTRLVYSRAPSATDCPGESALVEAVASRLGYDPFSPWGDQTILAAVSRTGKSLLGRAELVDREGIAQGSREVKLADVHCSELILALSLAISITLDPLHVNAPKAEPETEHESKPAASISAEKTTATPLPAVERAAPPVASPRAAADAAIAPARNSRAAANTTLRASGAALGTYGLTPQLNFGARLGVDVRLERWSLAIESLAVLPATWSVEGGGELSASLLAVGLAPCFEVVPRARLCAVGTVGSLSTESQQVAAPRSERVLHATAGGRASFIWPLSQRVELLASGDVAAVLNRPQFELDGEAVWRPSPVLATLAISATLRFF